MSKEPLDVGILYLCVYKKLEERVGMSKIMTKDDFFRMLGETFHVPKCYRCVVLKEMEIKGLIKDLGNRKNNNIEVNHIDIDIDNNQSDFYHKVGLF